MKKILLLALIASLALFACNEDPIPTKYYTVSFAGENVDIESQSVEHGKYAIAPETPERENYNFGGWFTDNGIFANEWDFNADIVTCDTTLYAKWEGNYPIEIPFDEYLLDETLCKWKRFNNDDTFIVINSEEELGNYIECIEGSNYPAIDFSTKTLLIANGLTVWGIYDIGIHFMQFSLNKYLFDIDIFLYDAACPEIWVVAILVDKLSEENDIELSVDVIR